MEGLKEIRIPDNIKRCEICTYPRHHCMAYSLSAAHTHKGCHPVPSLAFRQPLRSFFHLMLIHVNISIFPNSGSLRGEGKYYFKNNTCFDTKKQGGKYGTNMERLFLMRCIFYLRTNQEQFYIPLINIIEFYFLGISYCYNANYKTPSAKSNN